MKILALTNLYPPQDLGGYGRSIADFVWAFRKLGHDVLVLTSNSTYLTSAPGQADAPGILRKLILKGDFKNGIRYVTSKAELSSIINSNNTLLSSLIESFAPDAGLLGNLDLLGNDILLPFISNNIRLVHHVGFTSPPFGPNPNLYPFNSRYCLASASFAVRNSLLQSGLPVHNMPIVYPGVRTDFFGHVGTSRSLPFPLGPNISGLSHNSLGSSSNPLKICFAGLLMSTKGVHTVLEAMVILKYSGIHVQFSIAGAEFQPSYVSSLHQFIASNSLQDFVHFYGQLDRPALARFFRIHHISIFPSISPEAFGIVAGEAMASGLILFSSGIGGASEIFTDAENAYSFLPNNPQNLASKITNFLKKDPHEIALLSQKAAQHIHDNFSVTRSAELLLDLLS